MFTEDDKKEIAELVAAAMEGERLKRRANMIKAEEEDKANKETRLYLITFSDSNAIGLPDERGRSILSRCIYAEIEINPKHLNPLSYFSGPVRIVADADGRKFKEPYNASLTGAGVVSLVGMSHSTLHEA